jgi:GTP cyclohydrolase II
MISNTPIELVSQSIRLIHHNDKQIFLAGPVNLPIHFENQIYFFKWYTWLTGSHLPSDVNLLLKQLPVMELEKYQQSSVLIYGDFVNDENVLVRFHSICHTGDIFGSQKCDCGYQLHESMRKIINHGSGAIFYIANHEGRGIGLFNKTLAYILQEYGYDTIEANQILGHQDDQRDYEEAIIVLKELRKKPVTLITNNPNKIKSFKENQVNIVDYISIWGKTSVYNSYYIQTKIEKAGHLR